MIKFWAGATACLVGLCAGYGLASRNSSGTMAGINGPYVSGTTISSSVLNARLADIESELSDSKSRSGKGDFSAPVRGADGTVTAPTWSFTSETGTGLYRIGSSDLGVAINQVKELELTGSLFTVVPAATFSSTITGAGNLTLTGASAILSLTGATAPRIGIGVTPTHPFDVQNPGSAATAMGNFLEPSASNGNGLTLNLGLSLSANQAGGLTYTQNATAANSTLCFGVAGSASAVCSDGNNATTVGGTFKVGASGTATSQLNFGSCTLNGASPSVCTATVASGAKCVAIDVATTAATRCLATSVTTTTLTVTSCNGNTNVVNYVCF